MISEDAVGAAEILWERILDGEAPVDESVPITSSDVNRQTAERIASLGGAM